MTEYAFHPRSVSGGSRFSASSTSCAFTMVELALVVVIIGILATMTAPRFAGFLARQQVQAAAQRIVTDLTLTQRRAKTTSKTQTLKFYPVQNRYAIAGMADPDRPAQNYSVDLDEEPYVAAITVVNIGGDTVLEFDGYGVPDSDGTIIVGVGQRSMLVYVDAEGRATILEGDADGSFDLTPIPLDTIPSPGTLIP